jgi:D-amino-acid dehydrogenase
MKIIILGSGVLGVTSAYVLATRGYEVEVIDRQPNSAAECSYANGGQLSYSHAEPWANPGVLSKVVKWMFREDAPLVMRPRADLHMIKWGLKFLGNCSQMRTESNTVTMLRLGLYSRKKMEHLVAATGVKFDYLHEGILHVFANKNDFDHAVTQTKFQEKFGCHEKVLTPQECLRLEPTLEQSKTPLIGGIHAHLDESGDIHTFTNELTKLCQKEYNVKFHFGTTVESIKKEGNRIVAVKTDKGDFTADKFVMSMGSHSPVHLRKLGLDVPIYPMKGYSVTMPANTHSPTVSITDQEAKIVYSRLGDRLRVAGTAEFAGYNDAVREVRIQPILRAIKKFFPEALPADESTIERWACLRPSTPDGPPIIGKTPIENLFMNTGHGTLGWTQAAGSCFLLADAIEGKQTEISLDGLTIDRYL